MLVLEPACRCSLEKVCTLLDEVREKCSPTHYLCISLLETLHTEAYFPDAGQHGAAKAYIRKLRLLDCVAAGCCAVDCPGDHPGHPDNWSDADAAIQLCLLARPPMVAEADCIMSKYLPFIRMMAFPEVASELELLRQSTQVELELQATR
eukprot:TRINITY_DN110055_c0_g1_i1.p1 TRINITY_DN110055_c0_g1~~TRINITY_DN110055_c0_g1_i1.p1  ORF type:complete len:150 (+),score=32.78 TRINITY_DN110055_c0_g1_i1:175-624(+)